MGLAAECDPPAAEQAVADLLASKLGAGGSLPVAAFVTPDLKWVGGFRGYKDADEFSKFLEDVENSPVLAASPEVAKKLEALAGQATAAAEKALWPKVLSSARESAALFGRHAARAKIAAALVKAREYAEGELAKALDSVQKGGDRAAVRADLKKLASAFANEPEGKEADAGAKAVDRLTTIDGVAPENQAAAREKAAREFAGTRWVNCFAPPLAK